LSEKFEFATTYIRDIFIQCSAIDAKFENQLSLK